MMLKTDVSQTPENPLYRKTKVNYHDCLAARGVRAR